MTLGNRRRAMRAVHLAAAVALGVGLYSGNPEAAFVARWLVFPALAVSGLAMWLGPRLAARLGTRSTRVAAETN